MTAAGTWLESPISYPRLESGDEIAWKQLDARARGPIVSYAMHRGLQRCDAEDVAQSAIASLSKAVKAREFVVAAGAIKAYLFAAARRQIEVVLRAKNRRAALPGAVNGDYWQCIAATPQEVERWDRTWREHTRQYCLRRAREASPERDFRAFELRVRREMPIPAIAECLSMDTLEVSRAVYRVKCRLQKVKEDLDRDEGWLHDGALPGAG